ncbi:hypothetical protein [Streptomyces sp. CB09001]|uniref:hypothetical protein n=1 Tax=Streptomyces sp. CB09001 TaxID=2083284 RepID=UPI0013BEA845|nr:hypothetical protein [Streptomyces sp. CB09001]
MAATAVVYIVLLVMPGHAETSHHAGPMPVFAERLLQDGTALGERVASVGPDAAHVLERVNTLAPWSLVALGLLWLARRDQTLYVRFASALVLCAAVNLVIFLTGRSAPVRELPLVHGYWTLPAIRAGWYVLLALVAAATTVKTWPRVAVTLVATIEVTVAVVGTDRQMLAVLSAAVVPIAAWYSAGRLRRRKAKPQAGSEPLPLPRAG